MRLEQYGDDANITLGDRLIGSDADESGKTKEYSFQGIKNFLIAQGLGGGSSVDISGKVDKVTGKSLITDAEITRLAGVSNVDVSGKENTSNKSTNVTTDAASDTKYPSVKAVKTYVDANAGVLPYKVYRGLISQTSTGAPTVIVLENTIGAIVWTRLNTGYYKGTLVNAFTANKTFHNINHRNFLEDVGFYTENDSVNEIFVYCVNSVGTTAYDGYLSKTPIEIMVYN